MSRKTDDQNQVGAAPVVDAAVGHDGLGVAQIGAGFIGIHRLVLGAMIAPDGLAQTLPQGQQREGQAEDLGRALSSSGLWIS